MKQITYTRVNHAELTDVSEQAMGTGDVRVRTEISTLSCGTERANITDGLGCSATRQSKVTFPYAMGYSSTGIVEAVGESVTTVRPGDRVVMYWSKHQQYNVLPEKQVVRIEDERITAPEAALSFIATFPMAQRRSTAAMSSRWVKYPGCDSSSGRAAVWAPIMVMPGQCTF